ncbi:MAG: Arc family DNA-binding protein [Oscillospiraceae bacterium]|nr:Arc family DNA-binding protein [Oscillospiraceae bacterium]
MKADDVKLTVRINKEIARKLAYIAEYYGRSMNGQIYWLAKQEIARFEKEIGKIEETELEE